MCSNLIVMSTFAHNFYAVFCLSVIVTAFSKDVCTELDEHKISSQLHAGATPVGRAAAGTYVRDNNAHTLSDCILGCCESDGSHSSLPCNVAFFSNLTCYHIACNTSHPELCNYEERDGKKFKDTYYMTIRPIFTTSIKSDDENDVDSEDNYENQYESLGEYLNQLTSGEVSRDEDPVPGGVGECEPGGGDCGDMEMCHFEMSEVYLGYTCRCVRGFERNEDTGECDEAIRPASRMCTYGIIDDCFIHEECILRNSRARHGLCECEEDFERNQNTGWCELQQKFDSPSSSIQHTTVLVEKVVDETTAALVIATSDITTTTTTAPVIKMPTSTVAPTVETIVVSAGENKIVQLPDQTTTIAAFAIPQDDTDSYHYEWTLLTHPDSEDDQVGQMQDMNTPNLKLSGLIAGLYTFKVAVSGDNKFGESYVNVTVLNPARDNAAPCAIINPPSQQVNQPNDVVLDGSESTDDEGISLYLWEMVSKPLNTPHIVETDANKQILVLKNLAPGNYKFKLSVTDTDGLVNSTFSNVTVIREIDYPPMANAGSNVILNLPQNSITLNGNASTDDHGIESYEWMKVNDDRLTADMTGTRTPYLHLENLEVGDYTFTLKVTDSSGQTNSADVLVMVKAEHNRSPVPVAGENRVVFLPTDTISLDGSNSTDDKLIDTYKWSQVSGPPVTIDNSDRAIATVSHPTVGDYSFRLMVTDNEGLQASTTVDIQIKPNDNQPPVAIAGGDRVVRLPISIVTLDGSRSTDDRGVTSYLWTRDDRSLAAGDILNNTDRTAHLQLINLVAGRYIFTLTVGDNEGLQGTDSVTLLIKPDERSQDQIEIYLDTDLGTFTEAHKKQLQTQLAMLYHSADKADVEVVIQRLDPLYDTGQVRATFYVITRDSDGSASETEQANSHVEKGTEVVSTLKRKLETDAEMLDFKVIQLDTLVCQNNCSGHGHCDMHTKECICEAFWMQNPVRVYVIGDGSYNCEWSVLYVIIIAFILVIVFGILVWMSYCCCERCCRIRPKKRHRYSLLEDDDDNEHQRNELMPKVSKMQSSSLMKSESEFSTDEETLFISAKKQQTNGHVKNGFKHKNRVKT